MHHHKKTLQFLGLSGLQILPLWLLLVWLLFIIPLKLPNMGGSGLNLPQNIVSWAVMAGVVTTIWLTLPANRSLYLTVTARWLLLAIVMLFIPVIYTLPQWRDAALARWLGLMGGWVFYVSLLQYPLTRFGRHELFYGILTTATLQAFIALLQFVAPESVPMWLDYPHLDGRPYGVFQQVNVLASFIATGLALALMLFLLPSFAFARIRTERCRQYFLGGLLVLFSLILTWLQSRAGWLGAGTVCVLLLLLGWGQAKKQTLIAIALLACGITLAVILQLGGEVAHSGSNHARLVMLQDTLKMIGERPWLGWGYGGFEYSFQHYRLDLGLSTLGLGVVRHPHNEILLWWAEGGIIALAGMAILLFAGSRLAWRAWRQIRQHRSGESAALVIALLPLLLHTQTEYPFTLSTTHWATFLLLLALLDHPLGAIAERTALAPGAMACVGRVLPTLSTAVFFMACIGLFANLSLTTLERAQFSNVEPARRLMAFDTWVNTERWHYDQQTHALLTFNQTRDPQLLSSYVNWAQHYLSRRVDKNVYATWLTIAQYQQDRTAHHRLQQEAQALFPDDPRFLADFVYQ
ncbi:polymerase [Serratia fonticola]|nr:polymerase [Serratia fonticola]